MPNELILFDKYINLKITIVKIFHKCNFKFNHLMKLDLSFSLMPRDLVFAPDQKLTWTLNGIRAFS